MKHIQLSPFYMWGVRTGKFSTRDQVVLLPRAELESCCGNHPAVLPVIDPHLYSQTLQHLTPSLPIEFGVLLQ